PPTHLLAPPPHFTPFPYTTLFRSSPPSTAQFTSEAFEGVSCFSASACVAVGWYNTGASTVPLIETWNGATWAIQSSPASFTAPRSEEHTSELQSRVELVCRLLLEK